MRLCESWGASTRFAIRATTVLRALQVARLDSARAFAADRPGRTRRRELDRVDERPARAQRMSDGGIRLVTTEMVLFEWSETAGTDLFKQISRLVTRKT